MLYYESRVFKPDARGFISDFDQSWWRFLMAIGRETGTDDVELKSSIEALELPRPEGAVTP